MIKAPQLLADLTRMLKRLEEDLLRRIEEVTELKFSLQSEWQAARNADRTAETFETWVDQIITQAGVHWLLSCVFLRFIEDNKLVDRPWLSGTPESGNLALARDRHEAYFSINPLHSDREYLLTSFREAGSLPGLHTFFDERHNPVFRLGISGDAAMAVRQFWQQVDPNTGALTHDFTDLTWNTRFMGDLYQDLSEATRKRYALLQTPEFVEEFILDRTLTPAIREFGYQTASLIDPTCGSGHFLLGAFSRLVGEWQQAEPSRNRRDIAQKALDALAGVDLNPFAVAISRFRLLVAALLASDVQKLSEAPDFRIHVAIGDSLLHGKRFGMTATEGMFESAEAYAETGLAHAYASEDLVEVNKILGRQYHAVVGNPPYIVVKDAALSRAYRNVYASCHMKYSLGAPFTERFFELAVTAKEALKPAGFVGLITTNSFMKREFGSKLIEEVLPRLDLSHVIDTSGAYIPGHGTPTVILLGRHRAPINYGIRTVMGIKGEPFAPKNAADGLVWTAIVRQVDHVGSESNYVSVADTPRAVFAKHPWSIGGGGVADIKEAIESVSTKTLGEVAQEMGVFGMTNADEVMLAPASAFDRASVETSARRPLIIGDQVRDWTVSISDEVLFFYTQSEAAPIEEVPRFARWLWPTRTTLGNRATFGKSTYFEEGRPWWAWHQVALRRIASPLTIIYGEISTHNHFVFDRGGKVFNRTSPIIKLPSGASENDYLGLLGLMNSSVACFWLKQVCHNKGGGGSTTKLAAEQWENFFAFNSTKVSEYPLCKNKPLASAIRMDALVQQLGKLQPASLLANNSIPTRESLDAAHSLATKVIQLMIGAQEELDWHCYHLYELLPATVCIEDVEHSIPIEVELGERAFEIVLARRVAAGKETSNWFERHGSTPITEIPDRWPESYRRVVQRRIELIESDSTLSLLEQPLYKRRWNSPKWPDLEQAALREWLLDHLESKALWVAGADQPTQINTTSRLADKVQRSADFMQIARLYAGHADFNVSQLVAALVTAESLPFLPSLRYSESGLRKRSQWEDTWTLQRREDFIDEDVLTKFTQVFRAELTAEARAEFKMPADTALTSEILDLVERRLTNKIKRTQNERKKIEVGKIPVPPKYKKEDFQKTAFWDLRGGLDVPKERWVSYPGCERGADGSLPIAWAGWDHLQQATAIAAYYLEMKESEGWDAARLQPLLAGLLELVPWLEQWHNEVDPAYGERMGAYYKGFVSEEARSHGFTFDDLRAWQPAASTTKRTKRSSI